MLKSGLSILAGDVASADVPPTDQALEERLADHEERFEALAAGGVADFNARLEERGLGRVVTGVP